MRYYIKREHVKRNWKNILNIYVSSHARALVQLFGTWITSKLNLIILDKNAFAVLHCEYKLRSAYLVSNQRDELYLAREERYALCKDTTSTESGTITTKDTYVIEAVFLRHYC